MDKVVDHLLVFHGNAEIQDFPGNYTDYREWKEMKAFFEAEEKKNAEKKKGGTENAAPRERSQKERARKLTFKEQREFDELSKQIPALEEEKKKIEEELSSGLLSGDELMAKSMRIGELMEELDEKELRWLELSELS
jgi:ATP-binding cassette subfamily F protein uup